MKRIVQEMRDFEENPVYHVKVNDVNMYELFKEYPRSADEIEKYKTNYMNIFNSFPHVYDRNECAC